MHDNTVTNLYSNNSNNNENDDDDHNNNNNNNNDNNNKKEKNMMDWIKGTLNYISPSWLCLFFVTKFDQVTHQD